VDEFEGVPLSRVYVIEDEVQQLGYLDADNPYDYTRIKPALGEQRIWLGWDDSHASPTAMILHPLDAAELARLYPVEAPVDRWVREALARRWTDQARAALPEPQWTHISLVSPWREPLP
jgi:hypothetical protein